MENVYITKSTFNLLVKEADINAIPEVTQFTNTFLDQSIEYLHAKQFKTILGYKYFLEHPDKLTIYKRYNAETDSKDIFLLKTSSPKFHQFVDCAGLSHRFENMIIPKEIRDRGKNETESFRDYLLNEFGKFSPQRYNDLRDLIVFKINSKFNINISANEINILDEENSGWKNITNYSLIDLEKKITAFTDAYKSLCSKHPSIFPKFTLKAFLSKEPDKLKFIPLEYFKSNNKKEFVRILSDFHDTIQTPTYEAIKDYYRIYFNPELEFKGSLLQQLGLKPCLKCIQREKEGKIL